MTREQDARTRAAGLNCNECSQCGVMQLPFGLCTGSLARKSFWTAHNITMSLIKYPDIRQLESAAPVAVAVTP
jgi:hypothetical protein